jgi:hypothetical protein
LISNSLINTGFSKNHLLGRDLNSKIAEGKASELLSKGATTLKNFIFFSLNIT